jgi:hypothetical protein
MGGRDTIASSLHWGPTKDLDRYWKTWGNMKNYRGDYNEDFHKYSMEWTPDYMMLCESGSSRIRLLGTILMKERVRVQTSILASFVY